MSSWRNKLVNYNLIYQGKRLILVVDNKNDLKKAKAEYEQKMPYKEFVIQEFGVKVLSRNRNEDVLEWQKTVGVSLWQII
ncbi:MAG: hypothetical protein GF365_02120 [Candidatus Buchananbacteria bacterium]|nr:hypothetical protein [Candidatus Buchananbacteria bacterium]